MKHAAYIFDMIVEAMEWSIGSDRKSLEPLFLPFLDYLSSWGCAKLEKSEEDGMSKERSSEESIDSLAIVPWVPFHSPMVCEESVSVVCHPLEAEGEMMDTDEPCVSGSNEKDMEIGERVEAVGAFSLCQQQHHMMLGLPENTFTPMSR